MDGKMGRWEASKKFYLSFMIKLTWGFTFHMNLREIFIHLLRLAGRSLLVAVSELNLLCYAVFECKLCCPEILLVTVVLFTLWHVAYRCLKLRLKDSGIGFLIKNQMEVSWWKVACIAFYINHTWNFAPKKWLLWYDTYVCALTSVFTAAF
jgi:hypothetical protein